MLGFLKTTMYEEVQPLKLSDLILQGCELAPKAEKTFANDFGTCALGAAYHAKFGYKETDPRIVLNGLGLKYDNDGATWFPLAIAVANDVLCMPRELIAYTLKVFGK